MKLSSQIRKNLNCLVPMESSTIGMILKKKKAFCLEEKNEGGSLMVWRAFSESGNTNLAFSPGKINFSQYADILSE